MRPLQALSLSLVLAVGATATPPAILEHDDAEAAYTAPYLHLATGSVAGPGVTEGEAPAWPFPPLSIGHTMASYQRYGWEPYFHHGVDIRGDAGTPVLAAVGGKVVNVANYNGGSRLYWEVAVLDDQGYLWQYHHVDHESIPQAVKDAFQAGGRIDAGQLVGEIVEWPVSSFGEVYHHVHLNVLATGGVYRNPMQFLAPLGDDQGPEVAAVGLLDGQRRPVAGSDAPAGYALWARVRDLVRHDKFTVPPYSIEVAVDGGPAQVVWTFDSLPGGASRTAFVDDFYVSSGTCGDYQCRKATVDLGFQREGRRVFPATPGAHTAVVLVRDLAGNTAQRGFSWTVADPSGD